MELVERREGGLYVARSRVSLASIIHKFREGSSAETIRESFPSLSLAQVYGALAFYLNHPEESARYLEEVERHWDEVEKTARPFVPKVGAR